MRESNRARGGSRAARAIGLGLAVAFAAAAALAPAGAEPGAPAAACEMGEPVDVNAEVEAIMRAVAAEQVENQAGEAAESDYVVLNGRGYNYGPPPGVRFDPIVEPAPADPQAQ